MPNDGKYVNIYVNYQWKWYMLFYNFKIIMLHEVLTKQNFIKWRKGENTSLNIFQRTDRIFETKFVVTGKNRSSTPSEDFSLILERPCSFQFLSGGYQMFSVFFFLDWGNLGSCSRCSPTLQIKFMTCP